MVLRAGRERMWCQRLTAHHFKFRRDTSTGVQF
jgi:hypothetical protein